MFGKKPELKEGSYIFSVKKNGDFNDFIFGAVTGIDGKKVGITGVIVNPVGLKNKLEQGKTGERSREILEHPTPDNVVLALVYRVEHENYSGILDYGQILLIVYLSNLKNRDDMNNFHRYFLLNYIQNAVSIYHLKIL